MKAKLISGCGNLAVAGLSLHAEFLRADADASKPPRATSTSRASIDASTMIEACGKVIPTWTGKASDFTGNPPADLILDQRHGHGDHWTPSAVETTHVKA